MKVRTRAGLRLNLPFGMFKGAGTFVFYSRSEKSYGELWQAFETVKAVLYAMNDARATELADRLFVEKG